MTTAFEDRTRAVERFDFLGSDFRHPFPTLTVAALTFGRINLLIESETRPIGEALHRIAKRQTRKPHDEIEVSPMPATAEAVRETLFIINRKTRRSLVMEWTQAHMLPPAPLK